jgi:hypothetical protein
VAFAGSGVYPGSPGVVYQVSRNGGSYYRKLIIDGTGINIDESVYASSITWDVDETIHWDMEGAIDIEELSLPGGGRLALENVREIWF